MVVPVEPLRLSNPPLLNEESGAGSLVQRTGPGSGESSVVLVRRRRGLDRSQPTEPSPSMHQNGTARFWAWQSSSEAVDCVALVFP